MAEKCKRDETIGVAQAKRIADVGRVVDECLTHEDRAFIGRWPNPVHYAQRIEPKDVTP